MQRIVLILVAVLTALAAGAGLSPAPAEAAWSCGDTCNRTDPSSFKVSPYQVCADDAVTVGDVYNATHALTLQLRYSPYCRTVWGRIYGGRTQNYYVGLQLVVGGQPSTTLNATREIPHGDNRPYSWSYQWNDADRTIRACVSTSWSLTSPWLIMCTNAY